MDEVSRLRARVSELERALADPERLRAVRTADRLRRLAAATVRLTSVATAEELLGEAAEHARDIVGVHLAAISGTNGPGRVQHATAVARSNRHDIDLVLGGSDPDALVGLLDRPLRLTSPELAAFRSSAAGAGRPPTHGWLAVPLAARDGTGLGLVQVIDRVDGAEFDADDEAVLVQLAAIVSVELERLSEQEVARAALDEVRRHAELTETIAENASSALFLMDADGRPTYQNSAAVAMFGFDLGEIRDQPLHDAIHHTRPDGSAYPMSECPIDRALPERRWVEPYEDVFVRKDGTFVPVAAAASPILRDGVPVGTVVEVRDLELQHRTEAARDVAEAQLRLLVEASDALSATLSDTEDALREVARRAVPALGDHCFVDLVGDGGLRRVATWAGDGSLVDGAASELAVRPANARHPTNQALASLRPVLVAGTPSGWIDRIVDTAEQASALRASDVGGILSVPLVDGAGLGVGVLTLLATGGRRFTANDVATASELALRAASAVSNARLYHRAEFQRSLLEAQNEASVDGLVVVDPDGAIRWHNQRFMGIWGLSLEDVARGDGAALTAATRQLPDPAGFLQRVRHLYRSREAARDELTFIDGRVIERYGTPLNGPDGVSYGYLWSFRDITDRKRVEQELAELYAREQEVSRRLQAGLLTVTSPQIEQLLVSTSYRSATSSLTVGGDWFDAFSLPDGTVALVVGDVVGHGIDAAAVMGHLRGGVRAVGPLAGPAELLQIMTTMVGGLSGAAMSTMTCARYDPANGELRWACAGHPPPLVANADGTTRILWDGRSGPLWGSLDRPRLEAVTHLEPGTTLVLYTDGLIERRGETLDAGLARLVDVVSRFDRTRTDLAERISDALLVEDRQYDDVCVLTAHRPSRRP